ncbi:MAG: hypothetical protein U0790_01220 [Isosphaeraceae bacterium]
MKSWLARLASAAWLGWLLLLALMYGMLRLEVWHPSPWIMMAPLVVLVAASLGTLVMTGRRLVSGPRRAPALAALLLGLAPAWFLAAHFLYGLEVGYGRRVELNLPLKMLVPFGEAVLDVLARVPYPQRTRGERVVMISAPMPEDAARRQVAAMDRHISAAEGRLGVIGGRRAYWVRGPLLGLQGKAIRAFCLGSPAGETPANPDELVPVDRHEVAHVVIGQFGTADSEPPALLVEGWAEANSGSNPEALVFRAEYQRSLGRGESLSDLVGPAWYGRHEWPVYFHGAVLVNHLLDRFGPGRFLELYTTCRRASFAEDCRRILGVSLDELDRTYLGTERPDGRPADHRPLWLAAMPLGPGVDPAAWRRFVAEYVAAAEKLEAPYEHVRLTAEQVHHGPAGKNPVTWQYAVKRNGPLIAYRRTIPGRGETALLARPGQSFGADRPVDESWVAQARGGMSPEQRERSVAQRIREDQPVPQVMLPLFGLADIATLLVDPLGVRVARLERSRDGDGPFVRLELEETRPQALQFRRMSLRLDGSDFRVLHREWESSKGYHWEEDVTYDSRDGAAVPRTTRSRGTWEDGTPARSELTVTECRFEEVPESEFTAEALLDGEPLRTVPDEEAPASETPGIAGWYRLPLVAGFVSLVAGGAIAMASWRHRVVQPPSMPMA